MSSMSYAPDLNALLGTATSARKKLTGVNMLVVVMAIVLSSMVIGMKNTCVDMDNTEKFKNSTAVKNMSTLAIVLLVLSLLLFVFDVVAYFKLM